MNGSNETSGTGRTKFEMDAERVGRVFDEREAARDAARAGPAAPMGEPERLLRLEAVLHAVGIGRTAWFNLVRTGEAPQPIRIGRAVAWPATEVQAFIRERIRQSRGEAAR